MVFLEACYSCFQTMNNYHGWFVQQAHVQECVQELICDWPKRLCFYKDCLSTSCPFLPIQSYGWPFFHSLTLLAKGCYFEVSFSAGSSIILCPYRLEILTCHMTEMSKWNCWLFLQGKIVLNSFVILVKTLMKYIELGCSPSCLQIKLCFSENM